MNQEEVLEMGAEDEYTEEQEARDARLPSVLHAYAKALKLERATVIDSDLIPCIERASELLTTLQAAHDKLKEGVAHAMDVINRILTPEEMEKL